jgi:hypothetical protein
MLLLRALSARSYTAIVIGWKEIKLHGYRAENAMKPHDADPRTQAIVSITNPPKQDASAGPAILLARGRYRVGAAPIALARRASDGL